MKYLGIDGCRAGWVVATIESHQLSIRVIDSLYLLDTTEASKAYIDIPLHFAGQQYRGCELGARRLLGHTKNASVFLTPHQEAVYASAFADANKINKALIGKGVSIQAWNICMKIKEAVAFSALEKNLRLLEAHPELCFWFLNNRVHLLSKKSTAQGIAERISIIEAVLPAYRSVTKDLLRKTKRKDVKPDDLLDATVLAIRAAAPHPQAVLPVQEAQEGGNIFF